MLLVSVLKYYDSFINDKPTLAFLLTLSSLYLKQSTNRHFSLDCDLASKDSWLGIKNNNCLDLAQIKSWFLFGRGVNFSNSEDKEQSDSLSSLL